MNDESDCTNLIERLEVFEERLQVRLEALYAVFAGGCLEVNGELHPWDGNELKQDLKIVVSVYDPAGRMVESQYEPFYSKDFFGFAAFTFSCAVYDHIITKIRLYPSKYP